MIIDTQHELHGLNAHLSVGRRSATVLANESTVPPKAAADEILHRGRESHERCRRRSQQAAQPTLAQAAEATAEVARLQQEHAALAAVRADDWGPFHGDRLWLGTLSALLVLVLLLGLAVAVIASHTVTSRPGVIVGVVLSGVIAYLAGDASGRSRTDRTATAFASLAVLAVAASWALAHTQHDGRTLELVDIALLAAAGVAGLLAGRGRRAVPALRASEKEHRLIREIAGAEERKKNADDAVERLERASALQASEIATRTLRGVEEYLRKVDDERIVGGVFADATPAEIRDYAEKCVAEWPRTLKAGN